MIVLTVSLVLDVSTGAEAADAANEILREQQRSFAPGSCLIDYGVQFPAYMIEEDPVTYTEGSAFVCC